MTASLTGADALVRRLHRSGLHRCFGPVAVAVSCSVKPCSVRRFSRSLFRGSLKKPATASAMAGPIPRTSPISAAEALDVVRTWRPDVLVADIEMPAEDGYALIRKVRAPYESKLQEKLAVTDGLGCGRVVSEWMALANV